MTDPERKGFDPIPDTGGLVFLGIVSAYLIYVGGLSFKVLVAIALLYAITVMPNGLRFARRRRK